ncbi:MAG: hypothetical protein U0R28_13000 [Candidatus Nanopelagicales bacterium]
MRTVLFVLVVAAAVLVVLVLAGKLFSRSVVGRQSAQGREALGPANPADFEETVALVSPAEHRGFGTLRLTPTTLLFAGSGVPLMIPRDRITAVQTVLEVDGDRSQKPALQVSVRDRESLVFAVLDPSAWVQRLP